MSILSGVRIWMVLQRIFKGCVFGRIYYELSNVDCTKRCVFDGCSTSRQLSIVPRGVYLNGFASLPGSRPNISVQFRCVTFGFRGIRTQDLPAPRYEQCLGQHIMFKPLLTQSMLISLLAVYFQKWSMFLSDFWFQRDSNPTSPSIKTMFGSTQNVQASC